MRVVSLTDFLDQCDAKIIAITGLKSCYLSLIKLTSLKAFPYFSCLKPWFRLPQFFTSSPLTAIFKPSGSLTIMMVTLCKVIFNTALPFPNQIHSSLPHPSLWQWWMAAFTRLSPLHISLPVCLTTHIHMRWLFILLSFHLPQTPTLSFLIYTQFSTDKTTVFHLLSFLRPLLHLVHLFFHVLLLLFLPLAVFHVVGLSLRPTFIARFPIQYCYPSLALLSIHSRWLKTTEYDTGMTGEW